MLPTFKVTLHIEATDEKLTKDDVLAAFEDIMYDLPEFNLKKITTTDLEE